MSRKIFWHQRARENIHITDTMNNPHAMRFAEWLLANFIQVSKDRYKGVGDSEYGATFSEACTIMTLGDVYAVFLNDTNNEIHGPRPTNIVGLYLFVTEFKAIDPEDGNLKDYIGPYIAAPSLSLAREYCRLRLGHLKVTGRLLGEIPCIPGSDNEPDFTKMINHDEGLKN